MPIRPETAADAAAVRAVHLVAFPTAMEADLVARLHADGDAAIALVDDLPGAGPVGHVLFSPMQAPFRALGLGPVAVLPDHRRRGVADRLIRDGLRRAADLGWEGVFVLGDPAYYGRFGFTTAAAAGFASPYAGPYLMALAPGGGALPAATGRVDYAPAFADLA